MASGRISPVMGSGGYRPAAPLRNELEVLERPRTPENEIPSNELREWEISATDTRLLAADERHRLYAIPRRSGVIDYQLTGNGGSRAGQLLPHAHGSTHWKVGCGETAIFGLIADDVEQVHVETRHGVHAWVMGENGFFFVSEDVGKGDVLALRFVLRSGEIVRNLFGR